MSPYCFPTLGPEQRRGLQGSTYGSRFAVMIFLGLGYISQYIGIICYKSSKKLDQSHLVSLCNLSNVTMVFFFFYFGGLSSLYIDQTEAEVEYCYVVYLV